MSTNFMSLDDKVKENKETTLSKIVTSGNVRYSRHTTKDYKNVLHIGYDECYGDVFKCWKDDINCFTLHFGTKGDEFNK